MFSKRREPIEPPYLLSTVFNDYFVIGDEVPFGRSHQAKNFRSNVY